MKDLGIYLHPTEHDSANFEKGMLGSRVVTYTGEEVPELRKGDLVLIGVEEGRGSLGNEGSRLGSHGVREHLYRLYTADHSVQIVDFGTIREGAELLDTYHAVAEVVTEVVKQGAIPIIIGGGQDLTYASYLAYQNLEQLVNLVTVDSKFDVGLKSNDEIHSGTYLSSIFLHQPNYLFNYCNLAYQTYFANPSTVDLLDQLNFDRLRLGEIRGDRSKVEPLVRNADLLSFDLGSIRAADAPGNAHATPNGLTGDECCQITRYAGLSDKLTCIGFYEYNPEHDVSGRTAHLIAQMIWYFIEGCSQRKKDHPMDNDRNYMRYRVTLVDEGGEVLFYKSLKSDRWWMKVPYPSSKGNQFKRHQMVPCSYSDYLEACEEKMPELWMRTYQKFL